MTVEDAAKRIADQYALHRLSGADAIGRWFAARLSDGVSNGTLYDTKTDAVRGQLGQEKHYAYVQITPAHMSPRDAQTYLNVQRRMYDGGIYLADRDHKAGGMDMIKRVSAEDQYNQLRALFRGDVAPTNIVYGRN